MAGPLANRTTALANTMARQATLLAAAQRAAGEKTTPADTFAAIAAEAQMILEQTCHKGNRHHAATHPTVALPP